MKISPAKQERCDRMHTRDCPAQHDIEYPCARCADIKRRRSDQHTDNPYDCGGPRKLGGEP